MVYGAGELGGRVAAAWEGDVHAYTQSEKRHEALREAGALPVTGSPAKNLRPDDALLLALPGSEKQIMAIGELRHLPAPERAVLISSTGYYGLASGEVDEDAPMGMGQRAAQVAGLEAAFRHWTGDRGVILRMGGLYRPGRGPLGALKRRGTAPPGPPDKTLALIHYQDATTATLAALQHPQPEGTYLCVTPPCPNRQAFYMAACVLLDLNLPGFTQKTRRPPARYDVTRMRRDLLPEPAHPRWQEALVP